MVVLSTITNSSKFGWMTLVYADSLEVKKRKYMVEVEIVVDI